MKLHKPGRIIKIVFVIFLGLLIVLWLISLKSQPSHIEYGVSFSDYHSSELGLDGQKVLSSLLDDLQVRHFRLSAHWPSVEPRKDFFDFSSLDKELAMIQDRGGDSIMAVGRRLPGWPECHIPDWLKKEAAGDQQKEKKLLNTYIETTVNHFKNYQTIKYWQIENEPYLTGFAKNQCGPFDKNQLQSEIDLVHKLDPSRKILITDSGEFGSWYKAKEQADIFGTSLYLYVLNPKLGPIRYPLVPAFYRFKDNSTNAITYIRTGKITPTILIELSAEPWLIHSIKDTPDAEAVKRMTPAMFNEMIDFASQTDFSSQYLWGAEWWYYMKQKGNASYWNQAKNLFSL